MNWIERHRTVKGTSSIILWVGGILIVHCLVSFLALTCHTAHAGQSSHHSSNSLLCWEACQMGFPLGIPSSSTVSPGALTLMGELLPDEILWFKLVFNTYSSRAPPLTLFLL